MVAVLLIACENDPVAPSAARPVATVGHRSILADGSTMQDLGSLGGGSSVAYGINAEGAVVGSSTDGGEDGLSRGFFWTPQAGMIDVGDLQGFRGSAAAYGINDNGLVAGVSGGQVFLWTAQDGFVGRKFAAKIGTTIVAAINNAGQFVGATTDKSKVYTAQMWDSNGFLAALAGLPGYNDSKAADINDHGQVVGRVLDDVGNSQAFIWTVADGMSGLGFLADATTSEATGINNQGQVTGWSTTSGEGERAVIWTLGGGIQELPMLDGASACQGMDINDLGHVTGFCDGPSDRTAFLWTPERGTIAIGPGTGQAINPSGQVAGWTAGPPAHAWLWTPGPDNRPPTAVVGAALTSFEGSPVVFNGQNSSDPDGDPLTFTWIFGDGAVGGGPNPVHVYTNDGVYPVTLLVTDTHGLSANAGTVILVVNVAPQINAIAGATMFKGATFNSSGSFADPGNDPWSASVNYGDGSAVLPLTLNGKSFSLSHMYPTAGTFTVTVSVTDDHETSISTTTVVVQSPTQVITDQLNLVAGLVRSGAIRAADAASLLPILVAAIAKAQSTGVINLDAFISKVNTLASSGRISQSTAAELKTAAQRIIEALLAIRPRP
jgi:probable HAF family extracellular repeat protein